MPKRLHRFLLLAAVPALLAGIACGDDDDDDENGETADTSTPTEVASPTDMASPSPSPGVGGGGDGLDDSEDAAAIEQAVQDALDAYNAGDAEGFFGAMTDNGATSFLTLFGLPTEDLEAAKQEAANFIGQDPLEVQELTVTNSTANDASVEVIAETGAILEGDRFDLVQEGDEWLIDNIALFAVSPEIESGYETVDVGLADFAFEMDTTASVPAGNLAFALENTGEQPHEAVLVRVEEGVDLGEALQTEGDAPPEGIEVLGGVFNVDPGASYNMVFTDEIEAGNYALVCFLPNLEEGPEGTPHVFLGMVQEFTVE